MRGATVMSLKFRREVFALFFFLLVSAVLGLASVEEAMQLYSVGRKVEARRLLEQVVKAQPANFEAYFHLGLLALDTHDLASAEVALSRASQLQPSDAKVWLALAQVYQKSKQRKLSAEAAAKAQALASDDPVMLHGLAMIHSEGGRWAEAAALEARYAARAPQDQEAVLRAVTWHLQAHQPKPAIQLATRALGREDRADLHNLLGKAYETDAQSDKAIRELQEAIKLDSKQEVYYFDLAYVLLLHQNFDVAIQMLEASKRIFNKSGQLELALGIAYYGQRKFGEAVDSFLRTIELEPNAEQPYVFLARILSHAEGRLDEVTAKFARFAEANPKNYLGHFLHAKALIAQTGPAGDAERRAETEALLQRSIQLNSNFWESHFELGLLLEGKKQYESAVDQLKEAVRLNPKAPTPHYRLSRVYERLGQTQLAQQERTLHEKLTVEERSAIEKHTAGLKRLELVVK